jgi:hypothetical protein
LQLPPVERAGISSDRLRLKSKLHGDLDTPGLGVTERRKIRANAIRV